LLIDADHAADSPSRLVGLSEGPGLAELLGGQVAEDEVTARISFGFAPGLSEAVFHVMGPGDRTTELAALARADRAESVIGSLRSRYDLVLIAPPPLLASATGTAVGQLADGVIVAVKPGMSTNTLVGARRQLSFLGAERLGFVMIDAGRRSGA
jgi:Mrp family chromosome partitioning ATPase